MEYAQHTKIVNFIWGIADDVLRDIYVRGKYRDVILPMTVIRRLDSVLEPTKDRVLERRRWLDEMGIAQQDGPLRQAAGQPFFNTSPFTLSRLRDSPTQLRANFEAYLDGFSDNVQEILAKFKFRNQIPTLVEADALGFLIEKFLDPTINLSPRPVLDGAGHVKLPGLDNHAMGTIFEELIRRFNEENNEEAGEHFTPRDVVTLMADLIFRPIADQITDGTYLVYDGACGTGGMLTVAERRLSELARQHQQDVSIHLYGQEINPETYAICKADLLLKGEGSEADNIRFGSTLANDAFPRQQFDFMLSNPPYGKSWKSDLERMGGKKEMRDPRFLRDFDDDPEFSLITRSSDGQLLFLVNLLSKMKQDTALGSRLAEVHNGSSLFTGDAGQGESNIRRWIIEHDWLEAIVALPTNMFYNTGIATYVWVLTNRKPAPRRGKVQLIDATSWFQPLRKNLGQKNCELAPDDIERICQTFVGFEEHEHAKIFPNEAFGYWKVTVERPLRLRVELTTAALVRFKTACRDANDESLAIAVDHLAQRIGPGPHRDFNQIRREIGVKLSTKRENLLKTALAERDELAEPVIRSRKRAAGDGHPDTLHGCYLVEQDGKSWLVEYEPDPELRDTEQIPLLEPGGTDAFVRREVLPYAPDAWLSPDPPRVGYEISFTRYFYQPQPLRPLAEIEADIRALEAATDGLLDQILVEVDG